MPVATAASMLKTSNDGSSVAINRAMNETNSNFSTPDFTSTGVRCPTTKIAKQVTMLTTIGVRVEIATLTAVITAISRIISRMPGMICNASFRRSAFKLRSSNQLGMSLELSRAS